MAGARAACRRPDPPGARQRLRGSTLLLRGAARIEPYADAPPYGIDVPGLVVAARALAAEPLVPDESPRSLRLRR